MAVLVDLQCDRCAVIHVDGWSTAIGFHCECGGLWERLWTLTPGLSPNTHPSERAVVYESRKEGKVQYPGRADGPMPERLRRRGYERVELNVRDLQSFERKHGVANERRHYNRNNGFNE